MVLNSDSRVIMSILCSSFIMEWGGKFYLDRENQIVS